MFRREEELPKDKITGKRTRILNENNDNFHPQSKRIVKNVHEIVEKKKSGIRLKPTVVVRDKVKRNVSLIQDIEKQWKSLGINLKKHKYFKLIEKECNGKRSNMERNYGKYGGEMELDKSLSIIDKGEPEDALDFVCYLRDESLKTNKKAAIEACGESCRTLFLHQRLKSVDSQEYAKCIMSAASRGMRFGSVGKRSKTTYSQIKF